MKGEIVENFETKLEEQNDKTIELKSRVAVQENIINNLLTKCDDNEQYAVDDPAFLVMVLKVTTEMCWKRIKNATERCIYPFAKDKLTDYTGSVILEKKLKFITIKSTLCNLDNNSTTPDIELRKRN